MGKNNTKSNFMIQGTILAAAGIIVRIIGLVYRVPLNNILGKTGAGLYSTAYDIYSIFLLLSSLSLPLAVSKMVSARVAKGEVKNAYKIFLGALLFGIITGGIAGFAVYFGSDFLANLMKFPSSAPAIKVFGPTLVIMAIVGVIRGYFQGIGSMIPTAISQIFEQIANAIVSIVAAVYLKNAGDAIGKGAAYGAAGGTLGTSAGAFIALVFLIIVFLMYKEVLNKQIRRDRISRDESYSYITKSLVLTIVPVLLSTTIYNISNLIDSGIFGNVMTVLGYKESQYSALWGVYSGEYRILTTVPIAIASALSVSLVPSLTRSLTIGKKGQLINKVDSIIRFSMIIAIPCGVGFSMLAGPIIQMFFPSPDYYNLAVNLMRLGFFTVVSFSLSTITNSILQGIDRMRVPVRNAAISLIIHIVLILIFLFVFKWNIFGVVISDILFAVIVCILNAASIKKYLGYSQEILKTFILPTIAALIMGFAAYFAHHLMIKIIPSNTLCTLFAICLAIVIYAILLMLFKVVDEEELYSIPKGTTIVRILKKVHLLK